MIWLRSVNHVKQKDTGAKVNAQSVYVEANNVIDFHNPCFNHTEKNQHNVAVAIPPPPKNKQTQNKTKS